MSPSDDPRERSGFEETELSEIDDPLDPGSGTALRARLFSLIRKPSVRRRLLAPLGVDTLILGTNLVTGVVVARSLGTSGRGELAATLLIAQMTAWFFSMGSSEAISYHQARHPDDAPRLMSSWLAFVIPTSIVGLLIGELLLPVLFAAQTAEAIHLARVYLLTVVLVSVQGVFAGMLLGEEDFFMFNLTRFIVPAVSAIAYAGLWAAGIFSVGWALGANAAAIGITLLLMAITSLRRHGLAKPDWPLLRGGLWFGIRVHAGAAASLVNARLDLLIIPAFLSAASVGLYSVATNISSILPVMTGTVALMVLPVAARQQGSARAVILTMQATMGLAIAIAVPLFVVAPYVLKLVYGDEFGAATLALRILLPGAILQVGVQALWSGLVAANRPFLSTVAVLPGAIFTLVGLLVFLPIAGVTAAAVITSATYASEFLAMAVFYRRTLHLRWSAFIRAPAT